MKTTIILCEGPHDTAFVTRILKAKGFKQYKKAIKDYPTYLSGFIMQHIIANNVEELNLQEARNGKIIPYNALISDEYLIVLFSIGGDNRHDRRKTIITAFKDYFRGGITTRDIVNESLRIVFEMDADEKGIIKRVEEIKKELSECFGTSEGLGSFNHKKWVTLYGIEWGAYIFNNPKNGIQGRLEDIVMPMFIAGNEDISGDIETILVKRESYKLFSGKKAFNHDKAKIGMMGQLEKEGTASPAIIEQSSFITDDKIKSDGICSEMADYFCNW